ncbi:uncharacterized protein LOC121596878 [Anopheles merus]|uniref:RRM domain-containing protein n=1 Tax=Anopheles merus TaxID=30066 RepID=A0A182V7U6_ANOME|nr:uncharacterized protein LOC121596878 [Anopheles merus]
MNQAIPDSFTLESSFRAATATPHGPHALYLTNISPAVTKNHLYNMLNRYGTILSILYPRDAHANGLGMAKIEYGRTDQVMHAAGQLNGVWLLGCRMNASTSFNPSQKSEEAKMRAKPQPTKQTRKSNNTNGP